MMVHKRYRTHVEISNARVLL